MKVRLTAFNGLLKSEVKDWPEIPRYENYKMMVMPLRKDIIIDGCECERPPTVRHPSIVRFRATGDGEIDEDTGMYIEEMELIDVNPDYWYREGQDEELVKDDGS